MALTLSRYRREWAAYWQALRHPTPSTHFDAGMNRLVEAAKASPYISGHLNYVLLACLIAPALAMVWHVGRLLL